MADDDQPNAPEAPPAKPDIQSKVSELANRWLEDRFGLKVGDGGVALPDSATLRELGTRTEQFVKSFFQGFLEKGEAEKLEAMPSPTEVATRVALKTAGTVSNAFNDFLRDHAPQGEPVVIDGRFIARHGLPLLGKLIQSLGEAFVNDTTAEHIPERTPKVDVKFDLFKSVLNAMGGLPPEKKPDTDEPKDPT